MAEAIKVSERCKQRIVDICRDHRTGTFQRDETTYAYPVYYLYDNGEKYTIVAAELNEVIHCLFEGQQTVEVKDFAVKAKRIQVKN